MVATPEPSPGLTRAARYKAPEISPDEMAMVEWFRTLAAGERADLKGQFRANREPIGPDATEQLIQEWGEHVLNQGRTPRTVDIYKAEMDKFQQFLTPFPLSGGRPGWG